MTVPAVPTLREKTFITAPPEIIAYEVGFFLKAPASASDTARSTMESYTDIVSRNTDVPTICGLINTALTNIFNRIFSQPGDTTNVTVTNSSSDGVNYTITIQVDVTTGGQSYSISQDIAVDANGNLVLTF